MYPVELTTPMQQELTEHGFQSLETPEAVKTILDAKEGTVLVVINSVCGCAAAHARPAAKMALQNDKTPDKITTVFAGVQKEAVNEARRYMLPYPPSSPSIALFKEGRLVYFIERHHIEGKTAEIIANNLKQAFDEYC